MNGLDFADMRFSSIYCLNGNKAACLRRYFVLRKKRPEKKVTKRVFGYSSLLFIAVIGELLTYFFLPFRF